MSSPTAVDYPSFTEARRSLKNILDAVKDGAVVSIERGNQIAVVTDRARLLELLLRAVPSTARVVAEDEAWVIMIPNTPFAAEASSLDVAIDELIANLREYAAEWAEHFASAPNHSGFWSLVQLVNLSSDEGLHDWLTSGQE